MQFFAQPALTKRKEADLLVLPFWEGNGQKKPKGAATYSSFASLIAPPLEQKDFSGKEGELLLLYPKENRLEKRILLLGLGKEEGISVEKLRGNFSEAIRFSLKKKCTALNVVMPNVAELRGISAEESIKGISEGIALANYRWDRFLSKEKNPLLEKVTLIGILPKHLPIAEKSVQIAEGVFLARDLINGNADEVTPEYLSKVALAIQKRHGSVKTHIYDKEWIKKEKMHLFLAVAKGSTHEPYFIVVEYKGAPRSKDHTVIIGKGITFDTGGLNIKPTGSMETMRADMSGAAAVMGTMEAIASLKLNANVTAVVATCENAIGSHSYKPGDVFTSFTGKSVEISNTDAEGRLTLADAIGYAAATLSPTRIVDLATLTGAVVIALGEEVAGLMSNDDQLSSQLLKASEVSAELVWKLPLYLPYLEQLKSDIADYKNSGGRPGGAITAGLFLHEFVGKVPWAHIDIAGTAFSSKERHYNPKNGVGWGVRLLVEFVKSLGT